MEPMIITGVIITLLGLFGLTYCMIQAFKARQSGLEGEELTSRLQKLVAANMASFFVSAIGLAVVVIGILL